jgi:hypothetical protein
LKPACSTLLADWQATSATDPDKITERPASLAFGKSIVHWLKIRKSPLAPS